MEAEYAKLYLEEKERWLTLDNKMTHRHSLVKNKLAFLSLSLWTMA